MFLLLYCYHTWRKTYSRLFLLAEYDGYYTLADEEDAISYMNSFVPFPRNLNMQFLAHSNVRKWSDATKPFPFLYELDIDTKNRRRVIFRSLLRGLVNFIDSNSVGKRRNTQEAQDFIKVFYIKKRFTSLLELENVCYIN